MDSQDEQGRSRGTIVAARSILSEAERTHRKLGHENLGFLSEGRGFMPQQLPQARLPPEYAAWDHVAQALPRLYASLSLRRVLEALPLLPADAAHLPDTALLRASSVLAILVHAYQYVETRPPAALPEALTRPWAEVRERLGRPDAVLSYIDLIVYNFRLLEPASADPFRVENLGLLTPTVDTKEERRFYLVQTEILAQASPIVGAVVRAQEAAVRDDRPGLLSELDLIAERLRVVTRSLLKIDPNPAGKSHVDPVIWAKTVAPFAVPIERGVQGPSGTSSPLFNLLDTFFGRTKHESFLGREIRDLRRGYPRFWRDFLNAVAEVSVPAAVERTGDPLLRSALDEAMEAYAGSGGFLGRHRMKVYGYLELAFKVGRSVTIGGFAGLFKDRTWDQVDSELETSRQERLESFPASAARAVVQSAESIDPLNAAAALRVRVAIDGPGIRYAPGDRCGVLAANAEALVERTLAALQATGAEPVVLTAEWLEHVRLRPGFAGRKTLSLREVLRFGRIRPVVPRVAEALHAASQHRGLRHALLTQTSARFELWELLLELRSAGYATQTLWQCEPSASHYVSRVVPPENFRMYSIASAPPAATRANELELAVGPVLYREPSAPLPDALRAGTASSYLRSVAGRNEPMALIVDRPPRFGLPDDPSLPLVMIAGGTGIAPFLSFVRQRARNDAAGTAWLYWGLRSRADFGYRDELARAVASGKLRVEVAFSREDSQVHFVPSEDGGAFEFLSGARRRVTDLMLAEPERSRLRALLDGAEPDGRAAYLYVCGRSRFARSVEDALTDVLGSGGADAGRGAARLVELSGEDRYRREVFTDPHAPPLEEASFDASELVTRNDEERGFWFVIEGRVYDLSAFLALHPGGVRVLRGYAGMDATQGYLRAHARATEVAAMREMYALGTLRRPRFGGVQRNVTLAGTPRALSLAALYRAWLGYTYLVVEMQNALRADIDLQAAITTRDEPALPRSLYRLDRALETHERFLKSYAGELTGPLAAELWEMTESLCGGPASSFLVDAFAQIRASAEASALQTLSLELREALARLIREGETPALDTAVKRRRLAEACSVLESEAKRLLRAAKALLREGLLLFEAHESEVLERAGRDLLALLARLPELVFEHARAVQTRLGPLGFEPVRSSPAAAGLAPGERQPRVVAATRFWLLEHDVERNVAFLRRSAAGVANLAELAEQNDRIIARISHIRGCRGVVVDTRQAPPRNDPRFEQTMVRLRSEIYRSCPRVAVLVASAPGVLQVERLGREDDARTLVTVSESAAVQFAMGQA